jgi:hypothetical protein
MELGVWMCVLHMARAYSGGCAGGSGGDDMVVADGLSVLAAIAWSSPIFTQAG